MTDPNLGQPQAPQLTPEMIKNSQVIKCECGGIVFTEKLTFRKISAILSPTGREEVVPLPVVICEKCGKVPAAFDPHGIAPTELSSVPPTGIPAENKPKTESTLKVVK